MRHQAID